MAADLGKLFGEGSAARQLVIWQVLGQALAAVLAPELELLTRQVNRVLPTVPLTPAELAVMVVRHIAEVEQATAYARESGIAPGDFQRMVENAGEGPAPGELAEALRRGIIEEHGTGPAVVSFDQGIAESALRDKYREMVKRLAVIEPTPADALDALLEGQLDEPAARQLYARFGGDLEHFQWLFNARGSAPTPLEASDMANRGIIPWDGTGPDVVSYQQAFLEGPWRNKWSRPYRQLAEYRPPARTIVAMVRNGSLPDDQALTLFRDLGMSAEMAAAQLADAHHQKTQAERDLTVSEIKGLYMDRLIDQPTATQMLELQRYTAAEIGYLLDLWDFSALQAKVKQAVSKLHSLYVAHKISDADVTTALDALGVPAAGRQEMLTTWALERDANVQLLSAGEIADAAFYGVITPDDAVARLVARGWPHDEATIRVAIRFHGKPPAQQG